MLAFAILLLFPFIEIGLLVKLGGAIGVLPTFLLLILSGVVGISLLRGAGFATLSRVQRSLGAGELPAQTLLDGAFTVLSGILFLIPGFFTDILGLLCLFPPTRTLLAKAVLKRGKFVVSGFRQNQHYSYSQTHNDIEGEVVQRHDDDKKISSDRP